MHRSKMKNTLHPYLYDASFVTVNPQHNEQLATAVNISKEAATPAKMKDTEVKAVKLDNGELPLPPPASITSGIVWILRAHVQSHLTTHLCLVLVMVSSLIPLTPEPLSYSSHLSLLTEQQPRTTHSPSVQHPFMKMFPTCTWIKDLNKTMW